jgi:hypothetical protein
MFGKEECTQRIAFFALIRIIGTYLVFIVIVSNQLEDRTTIDMFSRLERGRPKTSPYDRNTQLKLSKRLQRNRDKNKGKRRIEVKLNLDVIELLDALVVELGLSCAEVIENGLVSLLDVTLEQIVCSNSLK